MTLFALDNEDTDDGLLTDGTRPSSESKIKSSVSKKDMNISQLNLNDHLIIFFFSKITCI